MDRFLALGFKVHDKIRDKMYVDIRQTFSVWFIPMYKAHVRLVTVLDLVASDDADFHDPLDRMIKQEMERDEKSTSQFLYHASLAHEHHHHHHGNNGSGPRRYKIQRQEDLYQVNDFLKFLGGPGPLPFLWFIFQLQATAICVLMSLFVRLSPWAFQPEPARGGVEAIIERVESYHDLTSEQTEEESDRHQDDHRPKPQKAEEGKPTARAIENHNEKGNAGGDNRGAAEASSTAGATNGQNGQHHSHPHTQHNEQREQQQQQRQQQQQQQPSKHEQPDSGAQIGGNNARRESANSKASPTQSRKGKSGKKGKGGGS